LGTSGVDYEPSFLVLIVGWDQREAGVTMARGSNNMKARFAKWFDCFIPKPVIIIIMTPPEVLPDDW